MTDAHDLAPLSPDATAAVSKLAGRVTDDPADGQELVDHLTDAVADYTSGRRRPTEADALVLVERHLGDPDGLAAQLARARGQLVTIPGWRRLAAVATATMVAVVAMRSALFACWWLGGRHGVMWLPTVQDADVAWWLADLTVPVLLAAQLLWWHRRERVGRRPWYARGPAGNVAAVVAGVALVHLALPVVTGWVVAAQPSLAVVHVVPVTDLAWWAVIAASAGSYLSTAWLWAAFAGRTGVARVGLAWAAFWCATASLYAGWIRVPSPGGPGSLAGWVVRPSLILQPWFETELTWAGIAIGGLCVLAARRAVLATVGRFHPTPAGGRP